MNIKKFYREFGTEGKCFRHFINYRKSNPIKCSCCNETTTHYYIQTRKLFTCSNCGHRISYKSGTVMEKSKLPMMHWYLAFYLLANTKKPISSLELQHLIGHKYYEPVWYMMHKIRSMMGKRDKDYLLTGVIELDESFIQTAKSKETKAELATHLTETTPKKRGKGTDKSQVLIMVQRGYRFNKEKNKYVPYPQYIKLEHLDAGCTLTDISFYMNKSVSIDSEIITDNATYYDFPHNHRRFNLSRSSGDVVKDELGGVHLAASNMKRNFLGIMHSINEKYVQNYLNEFAYRFNRRYFVNQDNLIEHLFKISFC